MDGMRSLCSIRTFPPLFPPLPTCRARRLHRSARMRRGDHQRCRRRSECLFTAVASALVFLSAVSEARAQRQGVLTIAVIGGGGDIAERTLQGIDFGIHEARHAAALFRRNIERVDAQDCRSPAGAQVMIYAGAAENAASVADQCSQHGVVFINAIASADSLRSRCSRFVYHVAASDAMRNAASDSAGRTGNVEMWHSALERFGAGQLNDRYRARDGEMGSAEWSGWMSVKVAWEASLRVAEPTSAAIAAWLSRDGTHFDGHKGAPLSFRSWDHQLRQPIYVVSDGSRIREVPSLSRSDVPLRDLLDSLAGTPGGGQCN
jgi:hypothetical protein